MTPMTLNDPVTPMPNGPLAHFLAHPGAETSQVLHHIGHVLATFGIVAGRCWLARHWWWRWQWRSCGEGSTNGWRERARLVHVLAPPEVDPRGAVTLWTNLVALLRPAWRRVLGGQPHLGFELTAGAGGLGIALWVPAVVPVGMVERAVEAAWPGARTETTEASPPFADCGFATGGELRLAQPEQYPLQGRPRRGPAAATLGSAVRVWRRTPPPACRSSPDR